MTAVKMYAIFDKIMDGVDDMTGDIVARVPHSVLCSRFGWRLRFRTGVTTGMAYIRVRGAPAQVSMEGHGRWVGPPVRVMGDSLSH